MADCWLRYQWGVYLLASPLCIARQANDPTTKVEDRAESASALSWGSIYSTSTPLSPSKSPVSALPFINLHHFKLKMLPKYSKIPDIEGGETVPFVSDHQSQPRLDSHDTPPAPAASATPETAAPTYPPGPAASVPNADGTHNVTYTFEPKWPVEGKTRHAMGVLGKTKAVCHLAFGSAIPCNSPRTRRPELAITEGVEQSSALVYRCL